MVEASSLVDLNNSRFFPWITTISMAVYILVGVQQLQQGPSNRVVLGPFRLI